MSATRAYCRVGAELEQSVIAEQPAGWPGHEYRARGSRAVARRGVAAALAGDRVTAVAYARANSRG